MAAARGNHIQPVHTLTGHVAEPSGGPLAVYANNQRNAGKTAIASRIELYLRYLDDSGGAWLQPDLDGWRDQLVEEDKAAATIKAYLSTVRSAYERIMALPAGRDALLQTIPRYRPDGTRRAEADILALFNEHIARLRGAIDPMNTRVDVTVVQDHADAEHIRLTPDEAQALVMAPDPAALRGQRDMALLALTLATGVREGEVVNVIVDDLRQQFGGQIALRGRRGKGAKRRLIPYGDMAWCLDLVDRWLAAAGITEGAVFRGVTAADTILPGPMSVRTVERIIASYPVRVAGEVRAVRPHDLRRSYARMQFDAGIDLMALQQNLGHVNIRTTQLYIGDLDAARRRSRGTFRVELA
ncbi:MAG: tyrosine-type recombinase/integrase [Anaerolineae bacterium]